ncbi:MAG TPA: TetR/AcrR family transcriptional regulator [Myxococcales bacterium]|nr:TetR/AcrR family transcriptional regulator [Myxococcales bacterium]HIK85472.1 TetR/AcrR family transcriptional regulator [Myxococcales bacterium]
MPTHKQIYDSPRQAARRASILAATRELISKRGYEGTTVRDVAELAGVAKGTLYNIYGGKDELIFSAVVDIRDDIRQRTIDLAPRPGLDSILKSDRAILEEILRTPTYAEAISRALFGAPAAKMLVPSLVGSPIELTRKELESAKLLGEIEDDVECELMARQLVMQRWGLIMAFSLNLLSVDQIQREVTHAMVRILQSIARPDARAMLDQVLRDS